MTIFAEVTVNDCINGGHLRNNEYIQFGAQQWPKWHLYVAKTEHTLQLGLSATAEPLVTCVICVHCTRN